MKDLLYKYLLALVLNCFNYGYYLADEQRQCDVGWFGSQCQYKCHCRTLCNAHGDCPGGCEPGWFGAKCQYQDLITFTKAELTSNGKEIIQLQDSYDTTCIEGTVQVDLKAIYYFTWLRAVAKYTQLVQLNVVFHNNNKQEVLCNSLKTIVIEKKYIDIQCFNNIKVRYVKLIVEGLEMCSLWISGGKNVALKQYTTQDTTYDSISNSSNAVDGNTDGVFMNRSCTHTGLLDPLPRWILTLHPAAFINRVMIYNRIDRESERLKKFTLSIYYESNRWSDRFQLNDTPTNIIIPKSVNKVKQIYVDGPQQIRHNRDVFLTLCEVETYAECEDRKWGLECDNFCKNACKDGCRQDDGECSEICPGYKDPPFCTKECGYGNWGENCNRKCSANCISPNNCHKETGHCTIGCKDGYKPPFCVEPCDPGFYGKNCTELCSTFCKDQDCYPETGLCTFCSPGYTGDNCTEDCEEGTWGDNCSNPCSTNCIINNMCDKATGECQDGCKPGYQIPDCEEQCMNGFYGTNCFESCSAFCEEKTCNHEDGTCTNCIDGFQGNHCLDKCSEGTWGDNCSNICSANCITNNQCDQITGECQDGCKPGFQTPNCEEKCFDGLHGANCSQPCSVFCEDKPCNPRDGTCTLCKDGYKGKHCLETCDFGFYGTNCSEKCSTFCKYEICYPQNGLCKSCIPGYRGGYCNEECDKGTWGDNCSKPCSTNCFMNNKCERITGKCQDGCKPGFQLPNCEEKCIEGFYGTNCSQPCSVFCEGKTCNHRDGSCTNCKEGYKGSHCLEKCKDGTWGDKCSTNCSSNCITSKKCDETTGECQDGCKPGFKMPFCEERPNKDIMNDFIQMLWEQKIDITVMLANTVENGKLKCQQYWPDKGTLLFGKIKVELLSTEKFADFSMRKLELSESSAFLYTSKLYSSHGPPETGKALRSPHCFTTTTLSCIYPFIPRDDENSHILTQFHLNTWPDQDVPASPWGLVEFYHKVSSFQTSKPIVVHSRKEVSALVKLSNVEFKIKTLGPELQTYFG
uniref:Tyrosine-protein phosphatase domain-containing protein n=1 Tax=Biomphalaria glabrata TaxID=6526 RepID=A0A2C9LXR7_BIOGL